MPARLRSSLALGVVLALLACKSTPTQPTQTGVSPSGTSTPQAHALPSGTSTPPTRTAPSGTSAPQTRTRSKAAADVLSACKMAEPPTACARDEECSTFPVRAGECGGCPSTYHFGVTASEKAAYLARNPCDRSPCSKPSPSCVVHWQIAEDGRPSPTGVTPVRCVAGACVTQIPTDAGR